MTILPPMAQLLTAIRVVIQAPINKIKDRQAENRRNPAGYTHLRDNYDDLGNMDYEPEKVEVNFMDDATKNHMNALIQEVEILKKRLQPHDTGYIHTTINTLELRITEMKESNIAE